MKLQYAIINNSSCIIIEFENYMSILLDYSSAWSDLSQNNDLDLARAWRRSTAALNGKSSDVAEQRLGEVKRSHHVNLARRRDESFQGRHRAGNCALAQEAHQADHRETTVVDFLLFLTTRRALS